MIAVRRGVEHLTGRYISLEQIFFITSAKQVFSGEEEKQRYFNIWLGDYLKKYPDNFYLALGLHGELIGYLAAAVEGKGVGQSSLSLPYWEEIIPYIDQFPAHFHLNIHPEYQRRGVGSALFKALWSDLHSAGVDGVHVVTALSAPNTSFYQKMGLTKCHHLHWGASDVVLLGLNR